MKPLAPVMKTKARLVIPHHLPKPLEIALDFVGGVDHLVGIVNHARRDEHYQLGAELLRRLRTKRGPDQRNAVQQWHPRKSAHPFPESRPRSPPSGRPAR